MRNSPRLPLASLIAAVVLVIHTAYSVGRADGPLTELQLGEIAFAITLTIFGIQGLISVVIEGQELHPGRVSARLTNGLSIGIVILSLLLLAIAASLAYGIAVGWGVEAIGTVTGTGCLTLSLLLVFYKEAFIGDEANFDNRQDGVPW